MSKKVYRIQDICFLVFRCPGGFASHRTDGKSVVTEEVCAKALPRGGRRPFCKKAWRKTFRIRCGGRSFPGFARRARSSCAERGGGKVREKSDKAGRQPEVPGRKASAATTGRSADAGETLVFVGRPKEKIGFRTARGCLYSAFPVSRHPEQKNRATTVPYTGAVVARSGQAAVYNQVSPADSSPVFSRRTRRRIRRISRSIRRLSRKKRT